MLVIPYAEVLNRLARSCENCVFPSAAEDAQMTICEGGRPYVCPPKYNSRVNLVTTFLCFGWRAVWIEVMYRNATEIIRYQIGRKVTDS